MNNITATPTKLRTGDWGARVPNEHIEEGDLVVITTKAGKSWTAVVEKVVWKGNGIAICATESRSGGCRYTHAPTRRNYGPGRCQDCGTYLQSWMDGYASGLCHDCF